ncbi:MAG: EAL domain-containing protein [Pseudomonadota bacterium]
MSGVPVTLDWPNFWAGFAVCFVVTGALWTLAAMHFHRIGFWSNRRFKYMTKHFADGVYRSSLDGRQICANPALVKLNGYDTEAELLSAVEDIAVEWYVDPNRRQEFKDILKRDGVVEDFVSEIYRHKTRERIWITENARLIRDKKGRPLFYQGSVREVTDTVRRLEIEERFTRFSEQVPGGLFQVKWGSDGTFTSPYLSQGVSELFGGLPEDVQADSSCLFRMIHPDDYSAYLKSAIDSARNQTTWHSEFRIVRRNGSKRWLSVNGTPEIEPDGSCIWHGFVTDITERKRSEDKIANLAFYDPLTSLPNRRKLLEELEHTLAKSCVGETHGALLFLDLDNFKSLNDSKGHAVGDELLSAVAERLKESVREGDLVSRFGGDEFVIVLKDLGQKPDAAQRLAESLAERFRAAIDQPFALSGSTFHTSPSIGSVLFKGKEQSVDELLQQADSAMYVAKAQGRNTVRFYNAAMQEPLEEELTLSSALRDAVQHDHLDLHFQKQVDQDGRIVGAEALLRWHHPDHGPISPARFIPIAEKSGLILKVNDWVLRRSLSVLSKWRRIPHLCDVKLSVNISPRQFNQQNFVPRLLEDIRTLNINPEQLVIELTEHVMADDNGGTAEKMMHLKQEGVGFSLDDFGTGYSSLAQLKGLPFDELKIDGSFVRDIEANESDRAIVRTIIAMAESLGITTVAEWVETEAQRQFLSDEGCPVMQGYLFGTAIPISAFETLVAATRGASAQQSVTDQDLQAVSA